MARGFTLIEMLISIVVLAILLAAAVPSFSGVSEKAKMQRLAEELQGFFVQTKSEAVLRNQDLYLHFVQDGAAYAGEWALVTNTSSAIPVARSAAKNSALMYLDDMPFKNVTISTAISNIKFESVNGKPTSSERIIFFVDSNKPLHLKVHNITGRIRVCGDGGEFYGYPKCRP